MHVPYLLIYFDSLSLKEWQFISQFVNKAHKIQNCLFIVSTLSFHYFSFRAIITILYLEKPRLKLPLHVYYFLWPVGLIFFIGFDLHHNMGLTGLKLIICGRIIRLYVWSMMVSNWVCLGRDITTIEYYRYFPCQRG